MISNSVTHRGVIPTPQSPETPRERRYRRAKHQCLHAERQYCRIKWRVFECFVMLHNVLRVVMWCFMMFYNISRCITLFCKCFMMFNHVLQWLVSHATIRIAASATADRPRWKINSFLSEISVCRSCAEKIIIKIERVFSVILLASPATRHSFQQSPQQT